MNELREIYHVPESIMEYLDGLNYKVDDIGKSNSNIFIFDDYILKISTLSFDIENEIRVYNNLKDKLPISDIIAYEVIDERVYILKSKLKGKMLCDDSYLGNPKLLFKLASDAVKLLWKVDVKKLDLQNTYDTIMDFGKKCLKEKTIDFDNSDKTITFKFKNFDEIIDYLENNKPQEDYVLSHGDLCLTNIIVENDEVVGFIDLGLTGISHRYHDLAILYRSIKYNMEGRYGKSYDGFEENALFDLLGIEKDDKLIEYYLLVDELLG